MAGKRADARPASARATRSWFTRGLRQRNPKISKQRRRVSVKREGLATIKPIVVVQAKNIDANRNRCFFLSRSFAYGGTLPYH
jgi:hypothetical protein